MKKILLLLMVMFTFANCSFAENWVEASASEGNYIYIDLDSIKFNKNSVNFVSKAIFNKLDFYFKYYMTLNVDSNECRYNAEVYNKYDVVIDNVKDKLDNASNNTMTVVFLKTLYKHHKELLARNIIITIETILLMCFFVYWKRKQKKVKVVIPEEKDNVEEHENN